MGRQFEFELKEQDDILNPPRFASIEGTRALPVLIEAKAGASNRARRNPIPVKARPPILPRDIAAEDAFRLTLLQCKWHIAANIPTVVETREVEGLHQMRVGFRRLRVALTSFGGDFRTPALEALRGRAKKLSEKLGPARDLDVFVDELLEPAAEASDAHAAFDQLRARAGEARRGAWDFAIAHVSSPGFASFMADFGEAVDRRIWFEASGRGKVTKGHIAFEMPAVDVANRMLDHRFKHAKKRGRHLNELSDEQRHKLRIALKKIRYTTEFFSPFYKKEDREQFHDRLTAMQSILGTLNDVVVARETLQKIVDRAEQCQHCSGADVSFAAGMVYGYHLDRAHRTWSKGKKCWKALAKAEPFWHSAAVH